MVCVLPSYAFIRQGTTQRRQALYTHHQYIANLLMVGCLRSRCDLLIRDLRPRSQQEQCTGSDAPSTKESDHQPPELVPVPRFPPLASNVTTMVVVALRTPEKQILVEPVFAAVRSRPSSGKLLYGMDVLPCRMPTAIAFHGLA